MVDLSTEYLGLKLRTPLVPSASPLSHEIADICRLEDAGASAVVLYSFFEEQLKPEGVDGNFTSSAWGGFAGARRFSQSTKSRSSLDNYLNHIRKAKQSVTIPIIASLNGSTGKGWTDCARQIQHAGADALECNIYDVPTSLYLTSGEIEQKYIDIVKAVKSAVEIPVAIKLSPFFANLANMAKRLDEAGANGLVLFNRFYQPDVNLEELDVEPAVLLSTQDSLRLPLAWTGILFGRINASLAASSGVHSAEDVIKLLLVGADVTMLCSTLLKKGIGYLPHIEDGVRQWMERREYSSIREMIGALSLLRCPNPSVFERAQYVQSVNGMQNVVVTGREAHRILGGY